MNLLRRLAFTALFAAVLALSLTACGGTSDEDLEKARQQGAEEQKQKDEDKEQEQKQEELEKKIEKLEKEAKKDGDSSSSSSGSNSSGSNTGGSNSGGVANCGNGLTVGPNTTCSFAENVRSEWASAGGGSVTIDVYSPVTGATYSMRCTAGTTTVCRGGNNASVYIR